MDNVNKTLYIPLYGKAFVSKKGIILKDRKAESIWDAEGFALQGKSKSKWLAYYMGMRSAVFDDWLRSQLEYDKDAIVIHIGCGMDSRIERVGTLGHDWYDVDFPDVISERRRYYCETDKYHMVESDARKTKWIEGLPKDKKAIVLMEGVSMYFKQEELKHLLRELRTHFEQVSVLMDCYTIFAARASKYKNPINDVGVTEVHGIDDPTTIEIGTGLVFIKEHDMTPEAMIEELRGIEKVIFKKFFGGKIAQRMYRLYEYSNI